MVNYSESNDDSTVQPDLSVPNTAHLNTNSTSSTANVGTSFFDYDVEDDEIEAIEHFKYKQDLERKLTVSSIIDLGFSLMNIPFGISSTLYIALIDGGNVTILWGWVIVSIFNIFVVLSLSEIISKYPTAGGVYHFSAILSNEKYSLLSSWITGWFLLIGNWTYAISIFFSGAQFILSIFGLKDVYYKKDPLVTLLVFFILLLFSGFVNFKFSKHLDKINKVCIFWSVASVLIIDFLLIHYSKDFHDIKYILTNFNNTRSGWPDPIAFMVGLQAASFTLTGYGMLPSMTDEVQKPERNMPIGMTNSVVISSIFGIVFIIPILIIMPELSLLLDANPDIMPIDLVFKIATESYVVSFLLGLLLIGSVFFQAIGSLTTASRTTYAFARDGGLPFKKLWVAVDAVEESKIPKNALILSMAVCAVLSLVSLLSSAAFNAFMGSAVVSLAFANGIPIFCAMLNKRRKLKGGTFRLRKLGWFINLFSVFWVVICFVILCLPPVIKGLTWSNMNYASVVFVGFILFECLGYYLWGAKSFQGPEIDTEYFELNPIHRGLVGTSNQIESERMLPDNGEDDRDSFKQERVPIGDTTATTSGAMTPYPSDDEPPEYRSTFTIERDEDDVPQIPEVYEEQEMVEAQLHTREEQNPVASIRNEEDDAEVLFEADEDDSNDTPSGSNEDSIDDYENFNESDDDDDDDVNETLEFEDYETAPFIIKRP